MTKRISFPNDEATLTFVTGILFEALTHTLRALAAAHGNRSGRWLDELEEETFRTIKNTHSERFPLAAEHAGVAAGLALLEDRFQALRVGLAELENGDDRA